jgi:hypothetical protein
MASFLSAWTQQQQEARNQADAWTQEYRQEVRNQAEIPPEVRSELVRSLVPDYGEVTGMEDHLAETHENTERAVVLLEHVVVALAESRRDNVRLMRRIEVMEAQMALLVAHFGLTAAVAEGGSRGEAADAAAEAAAEEAAPGSRRQKRRAESLSD